MRLLYGSRFTASGHKSAVKIPATAMERLLIAPSTGPISRAFAVPMAWEAVPMPTPRPPGL